VTAPCDRVERDGLVDADDLSAEDRAHIDSCPECAPRLARYRELAAAMRDVGAARRPSAATRAALWAAVDREPRPASGPDSVSLAVSSSSAAQHESERSARGRTSRRRPVVAAASVAAVLAAAAVIALAVWPRPRDPVATPQLALRITDGGGALVRGSGRLGDRLEIRARADAGAGFRVYRNDVELLLDCGRGPGCALVDGAITATIVLDAVAGYQVLWLRGAAPPPTGSLARDASAAEAAGVSIELHELEVR
jgi:hypothetical protein